MVNSNVDAFYGKGLGNQQTHTLRNASVALLLQGGIGRYLYASSYNFKNVFVGATYSMAYSDTIALPLLSTEVLDAISVGSEYTRIEKTLRVAEIPDSYGTLDVCVSPKKAGNCSTAGNACGRSSLLTSPGSWTGILPHSTLPPISTNGGGILEVCLGVVTHYCAKSSPLQGIVTIRSHFRRVCSRGCSILQAWQNAYHGCRFRQCES
jgi:hypothetical protein